MGRRILDTLRIRVTPRRRLHLLHIGKTGGTALKAALSGHRAGRRFRIMLHGHRETLRDVPEGDRFMFVTRDPISRFVSAFNSRRREGRPRYDFPWDEAERQAFARFTSAGALASALAHPEAAQRRAAECAMRSIHHVKTSYWDWFDNEAYFRSRLDDLFFIGRTESLIADFERLRDQLGLPSTVKLPEDPAAAHRSPVPEPPLQPNAVAALQRWYAHDYDFLDLCRAIETQRHETGRRRAARTRRAVAHPAAGSPAPRGCRGPARSQNLSPEGGRVSEGWSSAASMEVLWARLHRSRPGILRPICLGDRCGAAPPCSSAGAVRSCWESVRPRSSPAC
ncbi:MAG: sulfotransferase family 2 domain-containing protein [Planctomycetota bacterium]